MAMRSLQSSLVLVALLASGCGAPSHAPLEPAPLPQPPPAAPAPVAKPPAPTEPLAACTAADVRFDEPHASRRAKALTKEQEEAITAAAIFMRDHAGAQERNVRAELAQQQYLRARAYFEANHWGEAAVAFRALAVDHADSDLGVHASQLYIESLNVLGSRAAPPRATCYDAMARDVPILVGLYCTGALDTQRPSEKPRVDACVLLRKVQRDLERLKAQRIVDDADETGGDPAKYEEAAEAYLSLARRCIAEARAAHEPPAQERCDEIAYNAGRAFLAAKKPERAREAAQLMTDRANGMQASPLTAKLLKLVQEP